ncbi:MAG: hypothetical protein KatS3mg018_1523 [Fimbriimonadales bacterium]|nr:MAG: hypothetical protein KatS3mg018_1523 [Fimbriimonadales bacterium]
MITCAECGKPLDKVPSWYSTVNIRFVCDACRKVNPQHWLPPTLDEDEEDKPLVRDEDTAFVEGEVSLEELEKRDRKRLVGDDDLFDADLDEEPEE